MTIGMRERFGESAFHLARSSLRCSFSALSHFRTENRFPPRIRIKSGAGFFLKMLQPRKRSAGTFGCCSVPGRISAAARRAALIHEAGWNRASAVSRVCAIHPEPMAGTAVSQQRAVRYVPTTHDAKSPVKFQLVFQEEKLWPRVQRLSLSTTPNEPYRRPATEWTGCVSSWNRASTRQRQCSRAFSRMPAGPQTVSTSKRRRRASGPCPLATETLSNTMNFAHKFMRAREPQDLPNFKASS